MDLKILIQSVPNWESKTPSQILGELSQPSELYVDDSWWSLLGMASVIGDSEMPSVIALLENVGLGWAVSQAAGRGIPLGEEALNAKLRLLGDPRLDAIANATRRNISVLDRNGITADVALVTEAVGELQLQAQRSELITKGAIRWNAFCAAVDAWDGVAAEPEL